MKIITENKKAKIDYEILDRFEAGIVISGPEVKSAKLGRIELKGSYVTIDKNREVWLQGVKIASYPPAKEFQIGYQVDQPRKLLLRQSEILSLQGELTQKGLTIIPLKVYTKGSLIKVEIGLAKGRKKYDKRKIIIKREIDRQIRHALKGKF